LEKKKLKLAQSERDRIGTAAGSFALQIPTLLPPTYCYVLCACW